MKQPFFFIFTTTILLLLLFITSAVGADTDADADDGTTTSNIFLSTTAQQHLHLRGDHENNNNHDNIEENLIKDLLMMARAKNEQNGGPNPPFPPSLFDDEFQEKRNFVSSTLGSNMVLQRDRPTILWGFSSHPGSTITTKIEYSDDKKDDDDYDADDSSSSSSSNYGSGNDGKHNYLILTTKSAETTSGGDAFTSSDDIPGLWRQIIPPHKASLKPINIVIKSSDGEITKLTNILFGDVYICGGQSNMVYGISGTTNATQEAKIANNYPHIRLFTVGQGTRSDDHTLVDLQTIEQNWTPANEHSISNNSTFGYFSSVCWFFGREISNGLQNEIPVGLISNNWGGTQIELWQPGGALYNAMIYPYMVGPMSITGFTWYQGEANTKDQNSADEYAINFPKMITAWRQGFKDDDAYFGFIQLSTWCVRNVESIPEMRHAQMSALTKLSNIGYATNADHGFGCNIHPPSKQYCGIRLGRSALAMQYGHDDIKWKSPSYLSSSSSSSSSTIVVRRRHAKNWNQQLVEAVEVSTIITLQDVSSDKGLYLLDDPYNTMNGTFDCSKQPPGTCAWASLLMNNGLGWINATISLISGRADQLSFNATIQLKEKQQEEVQVVDDDDKNNSTITSTTKNNNDYAILATSYGWGGVPMMTLYDIETDLPVLPWKEKV